MSAFLMRQDGLVTRQQALGVGVSDRLLAHRVGAGRRWQRVLPGVYAAFTGSLDDRQRLRAGLLYAGPGALLTGVSAARLWGLRYVPDDPVVDLLIDARRRVQSTAWIRIRRTWMMPGSVSFDGALPVTPAAQAVVDMCRRLRTLRAVRAALCEVVQRGRATPEQLLEVLEAGASAGSRLPRLALADVLAGCRSSAECELRDLVLRRRVLPEPRWNSRIAGSSLVPDASWADARLVVEIDSVEWHRYGDAPEATERRRAQLAALGWTVVPVSPRRLREEPAEVLAAIEAAYRAALGRAA